MLRIAIRGAVNLRNIAFIFGILARVSSLVVMAFVRVFLLEIKIIPLPQKIVHRGFRLPSFRLLHDPQEMRIEAAEAVGVTIGPCLLLEIYKQCMRLLRKCNLHLLH